MYIIWIYAEHLLNMHNKEKEKWITEYNLSLLIFISDNELPKINLFMIIVGGLWKPYIVKNVRKLRFEIASVDFRCPTFISTFILKTHGQNVYWNILSFLYNKSMTTMTCYEVFNWVNISFLYITIFKSWRNRKSYQTKWYIRLNSLVGKHI